MKIGILGSGLMGARLGTILARAGHEVTFSYSRQQSKLERLSAATPEARAGTPAEAAQAEIVLLAVNWPLLSDLLAQAREQAGSSVVLTSTPVSWAWRPM